MYRCQTSAAEGWIFCCERCVLLEKARHPTTYRYGGTWKAMKA